MQKNKFMLVILLQIVFYPSLAGIYKCKDDNGVTQYSDVKSDKVLVETFEIQSHL